MTLSKITTPSGFRVAVEELSQQLGTLSAEEAALLADQIKGAAPKASTRFAPDDLDDMRIAVEALRNRLRRKWKRQRSNNAWSTGIGGACGAAASVLSRYSEVPPGVTISLVVLGGILGLLGVISLLNVSDWRDEVAKPIGDVADILAKRLAEVSDDGTPYRSAATGASTGIRVAPTIEAEPTEPEVADSSTEARRAHR